MLNTRRTKEDEHEEANRRLLRIGLATGAGLMGALDAIAFHHILQWHNFYVHGTDFWRSVSDGVLHIFSTSLLFLGVILIWRNRRLAGHAHGLSLAAGVWLGMGAFQLVDGTIFHKVLYLHPVREGVDDILPYDAAWIGSSLLLLIIGWLLWRKVRGEER